MKVEKITFMQTFPTGLYANQKLGMEIEIGTHLSDEEVKQYFKDIQQKIEKAFIAMNPQIQWGQIPLINNPIIDTRDNGYPTSTTVSLVEPKEQQIQGFIQAIEMANGEKALRYFEKISQTDPRLTEAYNTKLKSFQ